MNPLLSRSALLATTVTAVLIATACGAPASPPASSGTGSSSATQSAVQADGAASPASSVSLASATSGSASGTATPSSASASATSEATVATPAPSTAASGTAASGAAATTTATPSLTQLVGQKLVVAMSGRTASASLLGRIRRGEVGGVILFGANVYTGPQLRSLTASLRAAAAAGGQPRFLIAVDQEGGSVKRIPWAPPTLSPPQIGARNSTAIARSQGASTGTALKGLGINVNLAPVADVPSSTSSIMYRQGRTYSFSASRTAALSDAFATGLESTGVVPSMKHFPGLGITRYNTDTTVVKITASRTRLSTDLAPYRTAISHHIPLIMLSNATYTAYDTVNAAGWSPAIGGTLLRRDLGFTGATITDSLTGTASSRGVPEYRLALGAARAGTDFILLTGSESSSQAVFNRLLGYAQAGTISGTTLRASYQRILALKARL